MTITFYHNPAYGTSRNALAMVQASGDAARRLGVIEYLKTPPTRKRLAKLFAAAGITPRQGMRTKGNEALIEARGSARRTPIQKPMLRACWMRWRRT